MTLRQLKPADIIKEPISEIESIIRSNSNGEAWIDYKKYKSDLLLPIIFDELIIPPELYGRSIWSLRFDGCNMQITICNLLSRNGVIHLGDLRYIGKYDIQSIRSFRYKTYDSFLSALKETIEQWYNKCH